MKTYLAAVVLVAVLALASCASPNTDTTHPGESGTCYQHGVKVLSVEAYEYEGLFDPPLLYTRLSKKLPWIWPPWCQRERNAKAGYVKEVDVQYCPECTREYNSQLSKR